MAGIYELRNVTFLIEKNIFLIEQVVQTYEMHNTKKPKSKNGFNQIKKLIQPNQKWIQPKISLNQQKKT